MAKWADYLIPAVLYNSDREIIKVQVHEDLDGKVGPAEIVDKLDIAHNMKKGKTYVTIHKTLNSWRLGERVNLFSVGGDPYLRIDKNKVDLDNLGDIPDIDYSKKKDPSLNNITHTSEKKTNVAPPPSPPKPAETPKPEPEPELPPRKRGALPAPGEIEIPFEDIQPEEAPADFIPEPEPPEITETKPKEKSKQDFLDDYEQDYLKRLEQQRQEEEEFVRKAKAEQSKQEEIDKQDRLKREEEQRQKHKVTETAKKPVEHVTSPHGTLPAAGEVEIPFEDIQPEEAPSDSIRSRPEPAEIAPSPHGTLPAAGEIDVPFEQEQPPEAITSEISTSEGNEMDFDEEEDDDDEEPTPEQLARFEELEKQLEEIIQQSEEISAEPEEPPASPHGTLPAAGNIEIPFEEIQPKEAPAEPEPMPESEPEPEDDTITEQYEKISELADQIKKLEIALANAPKIEPEPEPEPETVGGMIEKFEETSGEQIEQLEKLEEQIREIEDADVEATLIEKLHKQMDRLNAIEERITGAQEPTPEQIARAKALEKQIAELEEKQKAAQEAVSDVIAYCVKCKEKRNMSNPEITTMKNGRGATKGTCSVCGTKMFRIGSGTAKSKPTDDAPTKEQKDRVKALEKQIVDLENKQLRVTVNGYCVKCRSKRDMINPEQTTMKNGKPAVRGTCSVCSTKMFKIGKM